MDNLPAGVSNAHPHLNPPDTSHDHEWVPTNDYPIIEDGAAIFVEKCAHETVLDAERGYRGETVVTESIPCEECKSFRFEYESLTTPDGETIELPTVGMFGSVPEEVENAVLKIERKTRDSNDASPDIEIDPDPTTGEVVVSWNEYTLKYTPQNDSCDSSKTEEA